MKKENKIFFTFLILLLCAAFVYAWTEPSGDMPSSYKAPINTTTETQDVDEGKPIVVNLDSDKLDGYQASDLLASTSGGINAFITFRGKWGYDNTSVDYPACPDGYTAFFEKRYTYYYPASNSLNVNTYQNSAGSQFYETVAGVGKFYFIIKNNCQAGAVDGQGKPYLVFYLDAQEYGSNYVPIKEGYTGQTCTVENQTATVALRGCKKDLTL